MLKVMVFLRKRDDLSRDQFREHWRGPHGAIALRMPGLRKYVHNHAVADGGPWDGIAEMWFDDQAAMAAALSSPAAVEAAQDSPNFIAETKLMIVDDIEMM
jgi:uncharacterized protein (TIGR02118 family)